MPGLYTLWNVVEFKKVIVLCNHGPFGGVPIGILPLMEDWQLFFLMNKASSHL